MVERVRQNIADYPRTWRWVLGHSVYIFITGIVALIWHWPT